MKIVSEADIQSLRLLAPEVVFTFEEALHRWVLVFSSGQEDMLARVDLYCLHNGHDGTPYRDLLDRTLAGSRFKFD
ncbi:MAG TPA: hypothetical protein VGL56_18510 [Fimbriimonadaceae bacterium]|jgi:hypothetical protein